MSRFVTYDEFSSGALYAYDIIISSDHALAGVDDELVRKHILFFVFFFLPIYRTVCDFLNAKSESCDKKFNSHVFAFRCLMFSFQNLICNFFFFSIHFILFFFFFYIRIPAINFFACIYFFYFTRSARTSYLYFTNNMLVSK